MTPNINLSPHLSLALLVLLGIGIVFGASGIAVWWRMGSQKGLDKAQTKQIDETIATMTDARLAAQKQEFDRQVGEIRSDQAEDRQLATERYGRLLKLEKWADKVIVFYRENREALQKVIALVPGGFNTLQENNITLPEPPTLPNGHD